MTPGAVLARVRALDLPAYGDEEVLFMAETMLRLRPTHVFEWGTNVGASARLFYEAASVLGFPCDIHTVELPPSRAHLDRDHPGERIALHVRDLPVFQHLGDGLAVSLILRSELRPERTLFYVDGCHRYDVVYHELDTLAVADPAAVVLAHDTVHLPEVASAVADFCARHPGYEREDLPSEAGMTRLWPTPAS